MTVYLQLKCFYPQILVAYGSVYTHTHTHTRARAHLLSSGILIRLFLAVLDLHCSAQAPSVWAEPRLLFVAVHRLLFAGAPPGVQHRLSAHRLLRLQVSGSEVVALGLESTASVLEHGPICSTACGISPDLGSYLCPLDWQTYSNPLRHQGSPSDSIIFVFFFKFSFY